MPRPAAGPDAPSSFPLNRRLCRCLRNVVSLFHVVDRELAWRRQRGMSEGFASLKTFRPIVAVGPEKPLGDQLMMADFFRASFTHIYIYIYIYTRRLFFSSFC